jgi:hypothetical protein
MQHKRFPRRRGFIELGDDFVETITRAVGSCDVLLTLIGNEWLTVTDADGRRRLDRPDDFVRLEIETALTRHSPLTQPPPQQPKPPAKQRRPLRRPRLLAGIGASLALIACWSSPSRCGPP